MFFSVKGMLWRMVNLILVVRDSCVVVAVATAAAGAIALG